MVNGSFWLKEGVCVSESKNLKKKTRNHFMFGGEYHVGDS